MILKDKGHGITEESIAFWHANKDKIGEMLTVDVTAKPLLIEQRTAHGVAYTVEYNFRAIGMRGSILLSGCNCGYGGTGPNGTAQILAELGLPLVAARKAMLGKVISFSLDFNTLFVDGKEYRFPMSDLRRETLEYEELLDEINYERGREVYEEMRERRLLDDSEYFDT